MPREPDPTLDALAESGDHPRLVYTDNLGADVPIWHKQTQHNDSPDCGTVDELTLTTPLHVMHARWIGVPCRICFFLAPPVGCQPMSEKGEGFWRTDPGLSWQLGVSRR